MITSSKLKKVPKKKICQFSSEFQPKFQQSILI